MIHGNLWKHNCRVQNYFVRTLKKNHQSAALAYAEYWFRLSQCPLLIYLHYVVIIPVLIFFMLNFQRLAGAATCQIWICDSAWPTDFTVYILLFSFSSYVIDYLQMIIDRYCLITVRYIHILLLRFLIINFNTATSISATFYLFLHVPQKMPVYQINRLISDTIHQGDIRFGNTAGSTVCM